MSSKLVPHFLLLTFLAVHSGPTPSAANTRHVINFCSHNLYPEAFLYDPSARHFIVGSIHNRSLHFVSDAGVFQLLIADHDLPENATFIGLTIDRTNKRLLAVVHSAPPLPPFNALAAYDLRTKQRVFLSRLDDGVANDVAADFDGNAYVTNSAGNFIWKVDKHGVASVFSRSPIFTSEGLNGIAYVSEGYLLVLQSNTGKVLVNADDGVAKQVLLNEDLVWGSGIAIREDGVVLVVSHLTLWFLKSQDSWGEGVVYDKTALDVEKFASAVAVGDEKRVYVLYGRVIEGNMGREEFSIEEIFSSKESEDDNVGIFVLVGLGFAYFLFWRFQMKQLVKNMDKKTN